MAEKKDKGRVRCPECESEIRVDTDLREGDGIVCSNCSAGLLVAGVNPVWVDVAPDTEDGWQAPAELEPLALHEVEEMEDEQSEASDDGDEWGGEVPRRVAALRASRAGSQLRVALEQADADGIIYLTPEGESKLRQELEHLQTVQLPKAAAWLSDTLSEGFEEEDVTELEEARAAFSFVTGRIRRIESHLESAQILDEPESADVVQLGSRVTVVEGEQEPETYRIVSPVEADPLAGSISYRSPLGKALMGHSVGDQVVVESPDGAIEFRISAIN
jgi:transcription elongation factor GreA